MSFWFYVSCVLLVLWLIDHVRYKRAKGDNDWQKELAQFAIDRAHIYKNLFELSDKYYNRILDSYNRYETMTNELLDRFADYLKGNDL